MEILSISLKVIFTPNTLGCYGFSREKQFDFLKLTQLIQLKLRFSNIQLKNLVVAIRPQSGGRISDPRLFARLRKKLCAACQNWTFNHSICCDAR